MVSDAFSHGFSMMAQPAILQGDQLGDNILKLIEQKPMKAFVYKDKGAMATI